MQALRQLARGGNLSRRDVSMSRRDTYGWDVPGSDPDMSRRDMSVWGQGASRRSRQELLLARFHRRPVVVAEQVEQPVRERPPPFVADDVWAQHDVAERARQPARQLVAAIDRERQHVRRLVK